MRGARAPRRSAFGARDGRRLAGLLLAAAAPRGVLVINNATGYLREFYLKFAAYCAQRGYHTLIYDYRGMGASACAPPAQERARMSDWGRLDMPAALAGWRRAIPHLPAFTLGHSVGGQLIGAMPNADAARAHVMIAASTGYWRRQRLPFRFVALAFWKLYGPVDARAPRASCRAACCGAAPSLPPGVFLQWRKWCLESGELRAAAR